MAGFDNDVMNSIGIRLEPSTAQAIMLMQDTVNDLSYINYNATPEGAVSANPGSFCIDRLTGTWYRKDSGTGNTGWVEVVSGPSVPNTFTTNSGIATPAANNLNVFSSGSIQTSGVGDTVNINLVNLTDHNVLVGAGTSTITKVAPSATAGVPLVSAGAAADPAFGTAVVAGGGTGATSFNINGVVISNTTGTGALAALTLTSGQIVIGGTTTPAAATLSAGAGVSIANGNNSITISASGGGFTWTEVTGTSQAAAVNNAYIANNAGLVTVTLPASFALGDIVWVVGKGAGLWSLAANTGDTIHFGSQDTSAGGSLTATNRYDAIQVVGTVANSEWTCTGVSQGNLTVA